MMPLRKVSNLPLLEAGLAKHDRAQVALLDMKRELDGLYHGYRMRALGFAALGAVAICVLLIVTLRSVRRCCDVLAPLAAAVVVTAGMLLATGARLNIFHLVALLLVVGVGNVATRAQPIRSAPQRRYCSVILQR